MGAVGSTEFREADGEGVLDIVEEKAPTVGAFPTNPENSVAPAAVVLEERGGEEAVGQVYTVQEDVIGDFTAG